MSRNKGLLVAALGVALVSVAHVFAGGWYLEYQALVLPAAFMLLAVALAQGMSCADGEAGRARPAFALLVAAALAATIAAPGNFPVVSRDGATPALLRLERFAGEVAGRTRPGDSFFALHSLSVVVAAGRRTVTATNLAEFSYEDVSDRSARELGLLNYNRVRRLLEAHAPDALVLGEADWLLLGRAGCFSTTPTDVAPLRAAVDRWYVPVLTRRRIGQYEDTVTLYVRR